MEDKKQEVIAEIKNPIRTGMALALGFFLMSLVLGILFWIFVAGSCATLLSGSY